MGGSAGGMVQAGVGGLQMLEAKNQADAIKRQAEFDANQQEFNSKLIGYQRESLMDAADEEASRRQTQVKRMLGSQKAALAAQGIDVNDSEVAQDVEASERQVGREDVQAIRNNAWRQALGLKIKEQDLVNQSQFTRAAGKDKARSTIVTGSLNGLNQSAPMIGKFFGDR